jgi:hypothetical protein
MAGWAAGCWRGCDRISKSETFPCEDIDCEARFAMSRVCNRASQCGQNPPRHRARRPPSSTACRPSAGAGAPRAHAMPSAAARACGQSSTPVGPLFAGGDTDTNGAVASHPAANGHTAGAIDVSVANLDAEAGTGIARAALRHDLDGPAAVERRSSARCVGGGGSHNCDGRDGPNG